MRRKNKKRRRKTTTTTNFNLRLFIYSSVLGHTNYIGFFIDWLIESLAILAAFVIFNTSALVYIGIFLYINGMKKDLHKRVLSIENDFKLSGSQAMTHYWPIYLREIMFHRDITKYTC